MAELTAQAKSHHSKIEDLESEIRASREKVEEVEMEKNEHSIKVLISQFSSLQIAPGPYGTNGTKSLKLENHTNELKNVNLKPSKITLSPI